MKYADREYFDNITVCVSASGETKRLHLTRKLPKGYDIGGYKVVKQKRIKQVDADWFI